MSATIKIPILERGLEPYPGYRLRHPLGRGGFGEVWSARAPDNTPVALKFLPCDDRLTAADEMRSIQLVRPLSHPNLIRVENLWTFPGYLVVSMELAEGTLLDLLDAYLAEFGGPILPEHLCLLLEQAAQAIDFLNTRQHLINGQTVAIQHCDVKPSNLLLFGDTVKLSDFSLTSVTTTVMKSHRRAGTLEFTAPEVFQGKLSDRTDQFALAVTYCQLRGGRLPFDPPRGSFQRKYTPPPPDLTMLSKQEQPLIARALSPAPGDRWSSCGEMMAQLKAVMLKDTKAKALSLPPPPPPERRRTIRHACTLRSSWRPLGKGEEQFWGGRIENISESGLALVSESCFTRGTVLMVKVDEEHTVARRPMLARVVRAARRSDGEWLLGCTFPNKLEEADLRQLLHRVPKTTDRCR